MLDKMIYTNHVNETITFGDFPYFANYNDLRNYEWAYTSANSKILSFQRGIVKHKLPVVIVCESEAEGITRRNALFEVIEKDVLANKHGTLQIGEYKLQCFVIASEKSDFLESKRSMTVKLTIVTDRSFWLKEKKYVFTEKGGGETVETEFLDFSYDFPYDYANDLNAMEVVNDNFVNTAFKMTIYGGCINPQITINGHVYEVNCTVEEGEILIIDSIAKTVKLQKADGTTVNKFASRNKESYIFEKIPAGDCRLSRNDQFRFDLALLEERSEPKWI